MLQRDEPGDYVLATGVAHSIRDCVAVAFEHVGLDWREHVQLDDAFKRPAEPEPLVGDAGKARRELGWEPRPAFEEMIAMMVDHDLALLQRVSGFWHGRRVLVTGHTGVKGAWLTLWLHRLGADVTGFSGPPPTAPSLYEAARVGELVHDVRGDIRDPAAVADAVARARPEVVFHLAAQAIVRAALDDPARTFAVNVLGTAHLLDAAHDAAVVCVTSDKCYAPGPGPHREGDPLGGTDPYSASKAAQELVGRRVPRLARRARRHRAGRQRDRRRRLGARPPAARPRAGARVRRAGRPPPPGRRAALAARARPAGRLPDARGAPARFGEWAAAWNFGPDDAHSVRWVVDRVRERWPVDVQVDRPGRRGGGAGAPPGRHAGARAAAAGRRGWTQQPPSPLPSPGTRRSARERMRGP